MAVCQIQMIDSAVQINFILTNSLPAGSPITDRGMLQSLAVMMDSSVSSCSSLSFCLPYFDTLLLGTCNEGLLHHLREQSHYHNITPLCIPDNLPCSSRFYLKLV